MKTARVLVFDRQRLRAEEILRAAQELGEELAKIVAGAEVTKRRERLEMLRTLRGMRAEVRALERLGVLSEERRRTLLETLREAAAANDARPAVLG